MPHLLATPIAGRSRRAMTLLEVIVSMAIFLMSFIAIASMLNFGQMHALEVQLQATGLQKAQSKMSDVIAGSEPLGSQSSVPFTEDTTGKWTWSMEADQDPSVTNLWLVKITVSYQLENDNQLSISLTEKLLDPSIKAQWYSNQLSSLSSGLPPSGSNSSSSTTGGTGSTMGAAAAPTGGTTGAAAKTGTTGGATMGGTTGGATMGGTTGNTTSGASKTGTTGGGTTGGAAKTGGGLAP
jgi:general secretion pathway protein I